MYKNRIRDLRRKKQISREQLAAIVSIKEPQLHAIEAGVSPARFNVAAKICAALDEGMQIVFPQTKKSLLKLHKDRKDIEDLFRDGAYVEPFAEAGIDMAPEIWILQLRPRHGAKRQYQISGIEKRRLWSLLQDEDRREFIVFDTDETRVAINAQHLLAWQFLFEAGVRIVDGEEEDPGGVSVFFADGSQPWHFSVSADYEEFGPDENDGEPTQLQGLLSTLEMVGGEPETTVSFVDVDGEYAFLRAADISVLEVALWAVEPSLNDLDEDFGATESAREASVQ